MTLIKYSTALLARQKGFSEITSYEWVTNPHGEHCTVSDLEKLKNKWDKEWYIPVDENNPFYASTQESLAKWLREKHDVFIAMIPVKAKKYHYGLYRLSDEKNEEILFNENMIGEYEEVFERALVDALNILGMNIVEKTCNLLIVNYSVENRMYISNCTDLVSVTKDEGQKQWALTFNKLEEDDDQGENYQRILLDDVPYGAKLLAKEVNEKYVKLIFEQ